MSIWRAWKKQVLRCEIEVLTGDGWEWRMEIESNFEGRFTHIDGRGLIGVQHDRVLVRSAVLLRYHS